MRVAIGLVAGSAALVWGDSLGARAMWAGQATSGAGVAVLYASLFAAHTLYHLLGNTVTFACMGLVTLVAGLLAVRRSAFILAVLGLLGGFLTPFLLATNEDHPIGLLAYVLLLDVGVLAVARKRAWLSLSLLGLAGSAVLYAGWASAHLTGEKLPYALGAAILVGALFVIGAADEASGTGDDLARATPLVAAVAPFVVALAIAGKQSLAVSPVFLVAYLLILTAQAFVVASPAECGGAGGDGGDGLGAIPHLRVAPVSFRRTWGSTLALFAAIPAAFAAIWFLRRRSADSLTDRMGAAIALVGSLAVLMRILDTEPKSEPILAL